MKKLLLSAATIASLFGATADSAYLNSLKQYLQTKPFNVNGKFYAYDFAKDGRIDYNDWIYVTVSKSNGFRLLATTPSPDNAFGFAPVELPNGFEVPNGYFVKIDFDQDQDPKFSWIYADTDGKVFKLMGATPDGKFDYLDIDGDGVPDPITNMKFTIKEGSTIPGTDTAMTITFTCDEQQNPTSLITTTPATTLTREQINEVFYMWNEEKLAHDLYLNLYNLYSTEAKAKPLYNIATRSETRHMEAVKGLIDKYDLYQVDPDEYGLNLPITQWDELPSGEFAEPQIQTLYDELYAKGATSLKDALEVGCIVEVTDVEDLDLALELAQGNEDLSNVFTFLRQGSYNHYWAFDRTLKNMGVSDGCCSLGDRYCKTPQEYPTSNGAQQTAQGNGNGHRGGRH